MTTLSPQRMHFTFLTQLPVMKSLSLMLMDHGAPMKSLCYHSHDPEHPYLSYILVDGHDCFCLPCAIIYHQFKDCDFYCYPPLPHCSYIKGTIVCAWKDKIYSYWCCIFHLYEELQSIHPGPYKAPTITIGHVKDTLFIITHIIMLYHDAVKYTHGLQHFIAEIQAFLVWGNYILGHSLKEAELACQCFCGAYVTSLTDFKYLLSFDVPVFYLTGLLSSELPPSWFIHIPELTSLCEFHMWTNMNVTRHQRDVIQGKLLHSKPLMFYPPHADCSDPLAFEQAAHGYSPQKDTRIFNQNLLINSAIVANWGQWFQCLVFFPFVDVM